MKKILVIFLVQASVILISGVSAVPTNSVQAKWEMELCKFENFEFHLCNPGSVRRSDNLPGCSQYKFCCSCPGGTFMDKYNNCTECTPLRNCWAEGKQVMFKGTTMHDTRCGDSLPTTPADGTTSLSSDTKDKFVTSTKFTPSGTCVNSPGSIPLILLCIFVSVIFFFVTSLFIYSPSIPIYLNRILCQSHCGSDNNQANNGISSVEQGRQEESQSLSASRNPSGEGEANSGSTVQ